MNFLQNLFSNTYFVFTTNGRAIKIIMCILFLSILGFFWFSMKYIHKHNFLQKISARVMNNYRKQNTLRQIDIENRIREDGESSLPILYKLDILLQQSGIKRKIPEFSAGLFLIIIFFIGTISTVVAMNIFNHIDSGVIAGGSVIMCAFIYIYHKKDNNMLLIEEDLDLFSNLMENYSYGTDSLYEMLFKATHEVNEPLSLYLEECCTEISMTGNTSSSLAKLKKRVSHPQFKKMISYLELASVHEANYAEIIELSNKTLTIFLTDQKKKRSIKKNTLRELLIIGLCGFILVGFSLTSGLITNVFNTTIGQILTIYSFLVLLFGVLFTLKK